MPSINFPGQVHKLRLSQLFTIVCYVDLPIFSEFYVPSINFPGQVHKLRLSQLFTIVCYVDLPVLCFMCPVSTSLARFIN